MIETTDSACCCALVGIASEIERNQQWHTKCIRKFFGVKELPELETNREDFEQLALSTVHKGMTVPGVQKKISLHLSQEKDKKRLTIVDYPTGYILKPQTEDFQLLPEYEFAAMQMAEMVGIKVVPYALLNTPDGKAYITKRIDRSISDTKICPS